MLKVFKYNQDRSIDALKKAGRLKEDRKVFSVSCAGCSAKIF